MLLILEMKHKLLFLFFETVKPGKWTIQTNWQNIEKYVTSSIESDNIDEILSLVDFLFLLT